MSMLERSRVLGFGWTDLQRIPINVTPPSRAQSHVVQQNRKQSCFQIQYFKCYFDFTYYLCIAPFRFTQQLDSEEIQYAVNKRQKVICLIFQFLSLLYIRTTFFAGWDYVKSGVDPLSYFDLMFLILLYGYDITAKFAFWKNQSAFVDTLEELQSSSLLTLRSSWTSFKVKLLIYIICSVYLLPVVFYIALVLGVNLSDPAGLLEGIKAHTLATLDFLNLESLENSVLFIPLQFGVILITIYTSAFWHYSDVLALTSALFLHRIASDFFDALSRHEIPPFEVMEHYESFKRLNQKFNKAAGWVTCAFLTYPLSYYATHLVDMLNDSDLMNRFSMCIYLGNLAVTLLLAAKINAKANSMKDFVQKHQRSMSISNEKLSIIFFELKNENIGINGFFTITLGFAGNIVNLLLQLAIITIQFRIATALKASAG